MSNLTAHCLVKNEENFIWYAIKSVINYVDQVFVFDTGSTDQTVIIVKKLAIEYPSKIIFEEKGECDKKRHTELRQEMLDRTTTDWFMILDGDEVWTKRGMEEAKQKINANQGVDYLTARLYYCLGDIYHARNFVFQPLKIKKIIKNNFGQVDNFATRFFKTKKVVWRGDFDQDGLFSVFNLLPVIKAESGLKGDFLSYKYWHLTNLPRSSSSVSVFSSGQTERKFKLRPTYFLIGYKIKESLPEVFDFEFRKKFYLNKFRSLVNFMVFINNRFYFIIKIKLTKKL